MLIQIQNVLAVAILSVLIVPSGVLSQQPPSPVQPPQNSEQRSPAEHETANNTEHPSQQLPFILDFLSADGLQKISAYCANKPDKDPDKWLHKQFICDVHITDVAIAIFTGLLVVVTVPLTLVGLCQSRIASNTARRQLRAYVFFEHGMVKLITIDKDRQFLDAEIQFKNFGETPAYKLTNWVTIDIRNTSSPPFDEQAKAGVETIIGPSGSSIFNPRKGPIEQTDIDEIRNGAKTIFIWGRMDYVDAFKKRRFFIFYAQNGVEIPDVGWQIRNSNKPNKAN